MLNSPWLRGEILSIDRNHVVEGVERLKVSDLWIPGNKVWNSNLISMLFPYEQAQAILNTPLFPYNAQDKLIWSSNSKDQYSVRSGYNIAIHKLIDDSSLRCEGDWNLIWNLQVQSWVKLHLWRACRETLPTKEQLRRRQVQCGSLCTRCDAAPESNWHLFISCSLVEECWMKAGLFGQATSAMNGVECFKIWCFRFFLS